MYACQSDIGNRLGKGKYSMLVVLTMNQMHSDMSLFYASLGQNPSHN
jgi:hypothetical protein